MTEAQGDYLADLAGRKGIRLDSMDNRSPAWASAKIEELKSMPDKVFADADESMNKKINKKISGVIGEVSKWTFQA